MKKNGFLTGIIGFLIVIAVTVVCFLSSLWLSGAIVRADLGDSAALATYPFAIPAFPILVFIILDIIFFCTQARRIMGDTSKVADGQKNKIVLISRIVAIVCVIAIVACFAVNIGWRTEYRDDSISEVFFVTQKEYKPENVLKYSLVVNELGAQFTVTVKGGKSFEILNNINTCSPAFTEKYGSVECYAAHLAELYDNSGYDIAKKIEWDKNVTFSPDDPSYESRWKYLIMIADGEY